MGSQAFHSWSGTSWFGSTKTTTLFPKSSLLQQTIFPIKGRHSVRFPSQPPLGDFTMYDKFSRTSL